MSSHRASVKRAGNPPLRGRPMKRSRNVIRTPSPEPQQGSTSDSSELTETSEGEDLSDDAARVNAALGSLVSIPSGAPAVQEAEPADANVLAGAYDAAAQGPHVQATSLETSFHQPIFGLRDHGAPLEQVLAPVTPPAAPFPGNVASTAAAESHAGLHPSFSPVPAAATQHTEEVGSGLAAPFVLAHPSRSAPTLHAVNGHNGSAAVPGPPALTSQVASGAPIYVALRDVPTRTGFRDNAATAIPALAIHAGAMVPPPTVSLAPVSQANLLSVGAVPERGPFTQNTAGVAPAPAHQPVQVLSATPVSLPPYAQANVPPAGDLPDPLQNGAASTAASLNHAGQLMSSAPASLVTAARANVLPTSAMAFAAPTPTFTVATAIAPIAGGTAQATQAGLALTAAVAPTPSPAQVAAAPAMAASTVVAAPVAAAGPAVPPVVPARVTPTAGLVAPTAAPAANMPGAPAMAALPIPGAALAVAGPPGGQVALDPQTQLALTRAAAAGLTNARVAFATATEIERFTTISLYEDANRVTFPIARLPADATWGLPTTFNDMSSTLCLRGTSRAITLNVVGEVSRLALVGPGGEPVSRATLHLVPLNPACRVAAEQQSLTHSNPPNPGQIEYWGHGQLRGMAWTAGYGQPAAHFNRIYDARKRLRSKSVMNVLPASAINLHDIVMVEFRIRRYRVNTAAAPAAGVQGRPNTARAAGWNTWVAYHELVAINLLQNSPADLPALANVAEADGGDVDL